MNDKPVVPSEETIRNKIEDRPTRANPKYHNSHEPKTYKIQRPGLLWNDINGQSPLAGDGGKQRPVD